MPAVRAVSAVVSQQEILSRSELEVGAVQPQIRGHSSQIRLRQFLPVDKQHSFGESDLFIRQSNDTLQYASFAIFKCSDNDRASGVWPFGCTIALHEQIVSRK